MQYGVLRRYETGYSVIARVVRPLGRTKLIGDRSLSGLCAGHWHAESKSVIRGDHIVSANRVVCSSIAFLLMFVACRLGSSTNGRNHQNTDWREKNAPEGNLAAHDFSLLGESIDLQSGGIKLQRPSMSPFLAIPGWQWSFAADSIPAKWS